MNSNEMVSTKLESLKGNVRGNVPPSSSLVYCTANLAGILSSTKPKCSTQ